jgi:hypothetical protein
MRFENGESRFLLQANLGRLTDANTVVEKTTDKSRSNVVASQLDVVRCETVACITPVLQLRPGQEGDERSCRRNAPRRARRAHCHTSGFFIAVPETQ